ncbi:MerR family transcriptional regulator [Pacificimonas flava]|uniref:Transcriptional regulator LiuR of leucine degradation pathway, MerR family n=1 Tax=Pacificimonas flava TaxID=1234595 RepID=M2SBB0_9SPHN|nr:MerR family DNA-binding transcriptional regulator [Pacificimonas flava]EMD82670.1 transcriptional regulator LiuR of leucine degradation pathway, MerR family [Pacificimonas flava]MBB5281495.1 DNA-binding transcriptional MerR regulator [Pacificimonas flava]
MHAADPQSLVAPATKDRYAIGELSQEFGVTARTIRFYESEGLLAPQRDGTVRIYSKRDRARLGWILRGKRVGFSLAEIAELLDMYERAGPESQRAALSHSIAERITALEAQRADLDATIDELKQFALTLQSSEAVPADVASRQRTA